MNAMLHYVSGFTLSPMLCRTSHRYDVFWTFYWINILKFCPKPYEIYSIFLSNNIKLMEP